MSYGRAASATRASRVQGRRGLPIHVDPHCGPHDHPAIRIQTTVVLATVFLLAACDKSGPPPEHAQPVEAPEETEPFAEGSNDPTSPLNFKGKIAKRYEDSEEWWPPFSLSEPFDVGIDNGTPVSMLYRDHYPYQGGTLDKVIFRLLD